MPSSQAPQQSQPRGRWRWETVQRRGRKRATTPTAAPAPPPSAAAPPSHRSAPAASAPPRSGKGGQRAGARTVSFVEPQWTDAQWAAWRAGGWRAGRSGDSSAKPAASAAGAPAPAPATDAAARDADVDAITVALREELLEARALEAAHAKSTNPCPVVAGLLAKRTADLRKRLDDSKPRQDVYELHVKIMAQLLRDADKIQQQSTEKWAGIADDLVTAREMDAKLSAIMARHAEMQADMPAKAQAAGVKPPVPKPQGALDVGAILRQIEQEAAVLPQQGPLADALRAMATASAEVQAQATAAAAAAAEASVASTAAQLSGDGGAPDATMGQPEAATASLSTDAAAEGGTPEPAPLAVELTAPVVLCAAAVALTADATPSSPPEAAPTVRSVADQAIARRAREVCAQHDGDAPSVATARSALRARIDQHPDDVIWMQRGIDAVVSELSKHGGPAVRPARQRSRSRSGGTEGDDARAALPGDGAELPREEPPAPALGKGPGGKSGKGDWPASSSARSAPYGC